jgi:hypothetical protein
VRIKWTEAGKPEQLLEVVSFLTDPSRLETAVNLSASGSTGTATNTSTSTKTSTTKTK